MGKFKNALKAVGEVAEAMAERNTKVNELAKELQRRSYGVDYDQAKKIAGILIDQAKPIEWK